MQLGGGGSVGGAPLRVGQQSHCPRSQLSGRTQEPFEGQCLQAEAGTGDSELCGTSGGPTQPCLQSEERWIKIKDTCEKGTADARVLGLRARTRGGRGSRHPGVFISPSFSFVFFPLYTWGWPCDCWGPSGQSPRPSLHAAWLLSYLRRHRQCRARAD